MTNGFVWTDQQTEFLKNRWDAGASARVIAGEIGTTRNAVLGKVHRLGLASRKADRMTEEQRRLSQAASDARRGKARILRPKREVKMEPIETPAFQGSLNIPFADLRPFSELERNQCRNIPANEPGPDYLACGNETVPGASYCPNCGPRMRANYTNTPAERAQAIRMGTREHLRAMRKAAA